MLAGYTRYNLAKDGQVWRVWHTCLLRTRMYTFIGADLRRSGLLTYQTYIYEYSLN